MSLTKQQALDLFRSDDLIGIGMEADAVRRRLHPEGVNTYVIERHINYQHLRPETCPFCAFNRRLPVPDGRQGCIPGCRTSYDTVRENDDHDRDSKHTAGSLRTVA